MRTFLKYQLILLLIYAFPVFTQITRINIQKNNPVLPVEDMAWIGTQSGLFQFDIDDDVFKKYNLPSKFKNFHIRQIYNYQDWLWCVLDTGLAALHLKLNEWLIFDSLNGLPSNQISGIDFSGDYVWISTTSGAARFDMLIEQWEKFDEKKGLKNICIKDIAALGEKVYILNDDEFSEYDSKFEKWRFLKFRSNEKIAAKKIIKFSDEIWFLHDKGIYRYNPVTQFMENYEQKYLDNENLIELFIDGNLLWSLCRNGLYYFDKNTNAWKEFEGNSFLNNKNINNGYISSEKIWILTGDEILLWDRVKKSWEILDYSSGLSGRKYDNCFTDGNFTLLLSNFSFEYRKSPADSWHIFKIEDYSSGGAGNIFENLLDNPEGGYIPLGNSKWQWQGSSITYLLNADQYIYNSGSNPVNTKSNQRLDVKTQIEPFLSGRLSGFYNNIDLNETEYGLRYRGSDSAIFREMDLGDFRRETGEMTFNNSVNLYGANIWLQYGPKTERFKRSLITIKANNGEIRTRKTYEHYKNVYDQFKYTISSGSYINSQYFELKNLSKNQNPEDIQVYIDDLNPNNNTLNTLLRKTIAGVSGDFDRFRPVEEFYYDGNFQLLVFMKPLNSKSRAVAVYRINNQYFECVLQDGEYTSSKKTLYYLNGQKIVPYTFRIQVVDSGKNIIPLSMAGIDKDGDGLIDNDLINYEKGIVYFPAALPLGSYLVVEYKTELSLIQLKHKNLLRGSEVLSLDGVNASGGNDYIIDYTNGTLLFVREGVLNSDTRIELEYEYYEEDDDRFSSAGVSYSPNDNVLIQADWQNIESKNLNILDLSGEIRQSIGKYDLKILPGIAYSAKDNQVTGKSIIGYFSSSWMRVQTKYQDYSENYDNLYKPEFLSGYIRNKTEINATADLDQDFRISGEYKKTLGYNENSDESKNISFLIHNIQFPNIRIVLQNAKIYSMDSSSEKSFIQVLADYKLPHDFVKNIFLNNLKFETFLRMGNETEKINSIDTRNDFSQWYIKFNAQISSQFQTGFFYRKTDIVDHDFSDNYISQSEKLLLDLSHEEWQLIQTNFRVENNLDQSFLRNNNFMNNDLRQLSQINFRISPGKIYDALNPLFFELNYTSTLYNNGMNNGFSGKYLWNFFPADMKCFGDMFINNNYYIKNEFRPGSDILLYSLFEWNSQQVNQSITEINRLNFRWNEKYEMKLGQGTKLILQYKYFYQDLSFDRFYNEYEPSVWIEHRFSQDFQNNINFILNTSKIRTGNIIEDGDNYQVRYNFILRNNSFPGVRYLELNQSLSGSYQKTIGLSEIKSAVFSSNTSLDLYPLYSLIIRLKFDMNRYFDMLIDRNTYTYLSFSLKATLKM